MLTDYRRFFSVLLFLCLSTVYPLSADTLKIAVAANFTDPMQALVPLFEKPSGHKVVPVFGATGKFYLQIKNGAPFEVFLAADARHPQLLEAEGFAVSGTRFTYATGKLVLWSMNAALIDRDAKVLEGGAFKFLALANPDVAPYGRAAHEYLTGRQLWPKLTSQLAMGQDTTQAYLFVSTRHADLGFVALSQIIRPGKKIPGSFYMVPQQTYKPLEQQAVLLKANKAGAEFLQFLRSAAAKKVIRGFGY